MSPFRNPLEAPEFFFHLGEFAIILLDHQMPIWAHGEAASPEGAGTIHVSWRAFAQG